MPDGIVVESAEYVPASTRRIASLTAGATIDPPGPWPGDTDVEGLAHPNNTLAWGVPGVDLGANTDHDGKLFFFFGDVPPENYDLVAYATDGYPEPTGIRLTPLLRPDGHFDPFQIRFAAGAPARAPGRDQTPTGAFSYRGRLYVFATANAPDGHYGSFLTRAVDPSRSPVYDKLFELHPKFSQVAPCCVQNSTIEGLPSSEGDGLIMFGDDHFLGVYLAWMPLFADRDPSPTEIRYWAGGGQWSTDADSAQRLFSKSTWTSISTGRVKELGVWMLLNQTAVVSPDNSVTAAEGARGRIVARIAGTPWDIAHASEVVIFDPQRDDPEGHYLVRPGGFAYGGYLLNRYTRWEDKTQIVTIWYLLSPFKPYQVQLMRSQIRVRAQFIGTFGRTPPDYRPFWLYAVTGGGDLMWYRKESSSASWQGPVKVGTGWGSFKTIVPAGGNSLYGITPDGVLKWYRHDGFNDGSPTWHGPVDVGTGWQDFTKVFSGSDGILYAIQADGTLLWYRHYGFADGDGANTWDGPKTVGSGWSGFTHVFSMGRGIIYAVAPDGTLFWYHHQGFATGAPSWSGPQDVASGWNVFRDIVPVGNGIIIGAKPDGTVFWHKHLDYEIGRTVGRGRSRLDVPIAAHWDGPVQIANGWQGWRAIIGLLPTT